MRHGKGVYQYTNLARYKGEWKKGLKHGSGKLIYPDGSSYCGDWKQNKRHGFGKYLHTNGDYYEGTWKDNCEHGIGIYKFLETDISMRATWVHGVEKGPVEIIYPNFRYHGFWNGIHPVGEGVFTANMKHMLTGHIEMTADPLYPRQSSETAKLNETNEEENVENLKVNDKPRRCVPIFIPHEIKAYKVCKLPQQPIPLPREDSIASICTQSSNNGSRNEEELFDVHSPTLVVLEPTGEYLDCDGKFINPTDVKHEDSEENQ